MHLPAQELSFVGFDTCACPGELLLPKQKQKHKAFRSEVHRYKWPDFPGQPQTGGIYAIWAASDKLIVTYSPRGWAFHNITMCIFAQYHNMYTCTMCIFSLRKIGLCKLANSGICIWYIKWSSNIKKFCVFALLLETFNFHCFIQKEGIEIATMSLKSEL